MIGKKFKSNSSGEFMVTARDSSGDFIIEFIDTGFSRSAIKQNILKGEVKDPMRPSIAGVGYIGSGKYTARVNRKVSYCYKVWSSMMHRCYNPKNLKNRPTYSDCSVCESWHNYQNFAKWFFENYPNDGGQYHIDKDKSGSRVYSPESCEFITPTENAVIAKSKRYLATSPDGVEHNVFNMTEFCKKMGLKQQGMSAVACGRQNTHRGWKCIEV